MAQKRIGVLIGSTYPANINAADVLEEIVRAEEMGFSAAWMVTGGASIDPLTLFASAIVRTKRILLGTCITTTFPRHPVVVAQQIQVLEHLAPGRFRLGVGPGHRDSQIRTYGTDFRAPLGHLREYLQVIRPLLHEGRVDFDGEYYTAHARLAFPVQIPVMASALQGNSFEVCGAESDGVIPWICPQEYLRGVGIPAMKAGAEKAGREVPPLVEMMPVGVHENTDEIREAMKEQFGHPTLPFYQRMFASAGYPEAASGVWSDAMMDAAGIWGDESRVAENLKGVLSSGATEIIAVPIIAGKDKKASEERTLRLLAEVSRSLE
jgi:F420-dependent oxidoreductase-like protein